MSPCALTVRQAADRLSCSEQTIRNLIEKKRLRAFRLDRAILIKREAEHADDIRRRMAIALEGPDGRRRGIVHARGEVKAPEGLPLFAGTAHE